ncbi:MAG: SAM hydrolase/SAM-dependent halogenase family protein, partial [Anaerolineales bacterium]
MSVITLTTDFGLKDGNVGAMKGVIWKIAPSAQIADISHLISPQNVTEAALVIYRAARFYPPGTIHMVVVDPGVGTDRRPIAGLIGDQYVVGPDNGVFTRMMLAAESLGKPMRFVHLNRPEFWLPQVSYVFHGRDIFAPAAAHLAAGMSLTE